MTANASEIWIMELFHIALYNRNLQKWLSAAGGELYGSNASPPTLTAAGADANVDLRLVSKGSGAVQANGNPVLSSVTAVSAVTGTPSASTYLRGDGTWSTPSGGSGGMLAPAQGMTLGDETFTISSGTVTQVSGTTINGYTPAIGDRILVANAPATTGTGSSYSMTSANQRYLCCHRQYH